MIKCIGKYKLVVSGREVTIPNRVITEGLHTVLWSMDSYTSRSALIRYYSNASVPATGPITYTDTESWGAITSLDTPISNGTVSSGTIDFISDTADVSADNSINGLAFLVNDGVGYQVVSATSFSAVSVAEMDSVQATYTLSIS